MARVPGSALVTGSSRGIGAATARALAALGHPVLIDYVEREDAARAVVDAIRSAGGTADALRADAGDAAQVERLVTETRARFGPIGVVVNNAGWSQHADFGDLAPDAWERALRLNLTSTYLVTRAALPDLLQAGRAGGGRVVNVCSLRAMAGSDHGAHYAASKAGLLGLTRSLARELGPHGVTVNAVAPGYTRTDMNKAAFETREEAIAATIPLRRVAEPEEIASVIAFLCSPGASYVTGEVINVNGGVHMR